MSQKSSMHVQAMSFNYFRCFLLGTILKTKCGATQNITGTIKKQTSDKRSEENRRDLYRWRWIRRWIWIHLQLILIHYSLWSTLLLSIPTLFLPICLLLFLQSYNILFFNFRLIVGVCINYHFFHEACITFLIQEFWCSLGFFSWI